MDLIPFTHSCEVIERFLGEWNGLVELERCDVVVFKGHANISLGDIKVDGMNAGFLIQLPYSNWVEEIVDSFIFILFGVFFASNPYSELADV